MNKTAILDNFNRGKNFLKTTYPILGGAMTWVSEALLVSGICNSGGFGVLASGSMDANLLSQEIDKTKMLTSYGFGVNLILINPHLENLVDVCIAKGVFAIILAGGIPSSSLINKIKQAQIRCIAFAPALSVAKKLISMGIEALIIEGNEAGGHIGPTSTLVLAQEIMPVFDRVPVFVAGGIANKKMVEMFLHLGASGCQLGTRFAMSTESIAHENFKNILLRSKAKDAVVSASLDARFLVVPVRSIKNKAHQDFYDWQRQVINKYETGEMPLQQAQLSIEHFWAGALKNAVINGDVVRGSVMAGQSVGLIDNIISVEEIIKDLVSF